MLCELTARYLKYPKLIPSFLPIHSYVGRAASASTATGSKAQHIRELNALLNDAIST